MNGQDIIVKFDQFLAMTRESFEQFAKLTEDAFAAQRPMPIAVDEDNIEPENYQLDLATYKAAPVVAVPAHSKFFPLQENGHRFLLAKDGFYLEIRRPWLHFIQRLVEQQSVAMPYGTVEPRTELVFGRLGAALDHFKSFVQAALQHIPNEYGDMLVWDSKACCLTEQNARVLDATPSFLRYECRDLEEHESIVFDLHSHGTLPAFFSDTDNRDDAGSVKISGVFGNLDTEKPTAIFRLCALGLYIPISVPVEKIFT